MNSQLASLALITTLLVPGFSIAAPPATSAPIVVTVTDKGFEPSQISVPAGSDVVMNVTRTSDRTCAKDVVVPSKKIKVALPLGKMVSIHIGKLEKGELRFGCAMDLMESATITAK